MHKEHQETVDQQVVGVTRSGVASEVLLLSFLMMGLTVSVLVRERYDGALDQRQRDRWGSLLPLWAERGTNSRVG